jgi:hypothetical protein
MEYLDRLYGSAYFSKVRSEFSIALPHVKVVLGQLKYPSILALIYGALDWYVSGKEFSLASYLKLCAPALFFIMWLFGMFERERKKASDKDAMSGLSTDIQSLKSLITNLGAAGHVKTESTTELGISYADDLMVSASAILAAGYKMAALLQAGAAFENAVRNFALRHGLREADRMSLGAILQKIDFLLPEDWVDEIQTLRRIRNKVAHASIKDIESIENPSMVLDTYALAIRALESRYEYTGLRPS